jgi:membrane-associated phospholipid phosphatase
MLAFSRYGREFVWMPFTALLWLLGKERHKECAFLLCSTFILAIMLGEASKYIMAELRPFTLVSAANVLGQSSLSYSFPSGHAVIVSAGAIMLLMKLERRISIPLLIEALLVSYCRVYVGLHWPADIIAGWLLGGFCATLVASQQTRLLPIYRFLLNMWKRIYSGLIWSLGWTCGTERYSISSRGNISRRLKR